MNALEDATYFRDHAGKWSMVMPLMPLPSPGSLSPAAEQAMDQLAENFSAAPVDAAKNVRRWLEDRPWESGSLVPFERRELQHELSDRLVRSPFVVAKSGRSLAEWQALRGSGVPAFSQALSGGFDAYLEVLMRIYAAATGRTPTYRTGSVGTPYDSRDVRVLYPRADTIADQVRRIFEYQKAMRQRPGIVAVVSLVAFLNVHPFADGNGRFARSVFNWVLREQAASDVYLPIREVALLSYSGYLLRVRQAEYFHEWQPLAEFLLMICQRLFRLQ